MSSSKLDGGAKTPSVIHDTPTPKSGDDLGKSSRNASFGSAQLENRYSREPDLQLQEEKQHGNPRVSVVTVTFNSERTVARTLRSIFEQSTAPFEIVVVDGGSRDRTIEMVAGMKEESKLPIILLTGVQGSRGRCRNVGLENCSGDIVAFLDSDCEAPSDWLGNVVTSMHNPSSGVKGVVGPYVPPIGSNVFSRATYHLLGASTGKLTAQFLRKEDGPKHVREMPCGNCAFEKRAVLEVGGFDSRLDYCEDVDMSSRLSSSGHRLLFVPSLFVYHDWNGWRGLSQLAFAAVKYGKGRAIASRIKPSLFPYGYLLLLAALFIGVAIELLLATLSPFYLMVPVGAAALYLVFCSTLMLRHRTFDVRAVLSPVVFLTSYGLGILSGSFQSKQDLTGLR